MERFLVVLSVFVASAFCDPFLIRDCSPDSRTVQLNSGSVNPQEVPVPGDIAVTGSVTVFKAAKDAQYDLDVKISQYWGFLWVPVPCISNVGSCKYDLCTLLGNDTCPPELDSNGIPCTCNTIKPGTYSLNAQKFTIPPLTGVWSWLATGDYKVDMTLTDRTTGTKVGCLYGEVTVVDPTACSGFLCSIIGG